MKVVVLHRPYPPNMPGEICGFPDHVADRLIAQGAATAVVPEPTQGETAERSAAMEGAEESDKKDAPPAARTTMVRKPPAAAVPSKTPRAPK